jgi:hypothetical protein
VIRSVIYFEIYAYCGGRGFGVELVVAVAYEYWIVELVRGDFPFGDGGKYKRTFRLRRDLSLGFLMLGGILQMSS